jgi:hypothetical protein
MFNRTQKQPTYDLPNMAAVADETRSYTDPKASYDLAQKARTARAEGATRRPS